MSRFSPSRVDVYDIVHDICKGSSQSVDDMLRNTIFYACFTDRYIPLTINHYKDLVMYFAHKVYYHYFAQGQHSIFISSRSYVDMAEERELKHLLHKALRQYKWDMFWHKQFNITKFIRRETWLVPKRHVYDVAARVQSDGAQASIDGLYIELFDEMYRRPLQQKLLEAGYSESYIDNWVYHIAERNKGENYGN